MEIMGPMGWGDPMGHLQTAVACTEARMEKLLQAGRETQRHLAALIYEYDLQKGCGRLQYLIRIVCDLHADWKDAQKRLKEGCLAPSHSTSL